MFEELDVKSVFDLHPGVDVLYVVNNVPFVRKDDAQAYSASAGHKLNVVERKEVETTLPKTKSKKLANGAEKGSDTDPEA